MYHEVDDAVKTDILTVYIFNLFQQMLLVNGGEEVLLNHLQYISIYNLSYCRD